MGLRQQCRARGAIKLEFCSTFPLQADVSPPGLLVPSLPRRPDFMSALTRAFSTSSTNALGAALLGRLGGFCGGLFSWLVAFARPPFRSREAEPEDLSGNLIVQLGLVTESQSAFRFFGLAPFSSGSLSRISNMAVVRRRMDSARDGRSCLRRHSSRRSKNSSERGFLWGSRVKWREHEGRPQARRL
jgi:hypothetical protein